MLFSPCAKRLKCVYLCNSDIDVPVVCGSDADKPVYWWDAEADKCLLVGVFKHGM